MTDLLSPARRTSTRPSAERPGRSPVTAGVLGGLGASTTTLLVAVAVALGGWFGADAGRYGETTDAVRVGADAWLMAHGAGLRLDGAVLTAVPLGLTVLCAVVTLRAGRWVASTAGLTRALEDRRPLLHAVGVMATVYAVVAMSTAVLATHPRAEPGLLRALVGGFVLAALAGGAGALSGSGQAGVVLGGLPTWARSVLRGAAAATALLVAAAAVLVAAALLLDFGTAATVLSRLHTDGPGGLMYTVVGVLFVPNAVLLGAAYLLGPGFALGTGTVVSPTAVVLGPLPSFPMLAALPDTGNTPGWTVALIAVPVVTTAVAVALGLRRSAVPRVDLGALWGLGAGLLAALAVALLVAPAGGAAGPGRMADVGADVPAVLLAAAVSCGGGGLLGGAVGSWLSRRRTSAR